MQDTSDSLPINIFLSAGLIVRQFYCAILLAGKIQRRQRIYLQQKFIISHRQYWRIHTTQHVTMERREITAVKLLLLLLAMLVKLKEAVSKRQCNT